MQVSQCKTVVNIRSRMMIIISWNFLNLHYVHIRISVISNCKLIK